MQQQDTANYAQESQDSELSHIDDETESENAESNEESTLSESEEEISTSSSENDFPLFMKLVLLFLAINPLMGIYYAYDSVGAAAPELERQNITNAQEMGYLYTAYFGPGVFTSLVAGVMVDKIGLRISAPLFISPVIIGCSLVVVGIHYELFWLTLLGRIFTGFGECTIVVQITMLGILFSGMWRDIAFAVVEVWAHVGSIAVFSIIPAVLPSGIVVAMCTAIGFGAFGWLTNVIFSILDSRYNLQAAKNKGKGTQRMKLSDLRQIPVPFWFLVISSSTHQACYWTGMSFMALYLTELGYSDTLAGLIVSAANLIVLGAPIASYLVSLSQKRCIIWVVSGLVTCISWILIAVQIFPVLFIILLGVNYAILIPTFSAAFPFLVKEHILGSAYGISVFLFNLLSVIFPLVIGSLKGSTGSFMWPFLILAFFCFVQAICLTVLLVIDYSKKLFVSQKQ